MTPEQQAVLDKYMATKEGRAKLAASMVVPVRCGGCTYDKDGNAWLFLGGWWVPHSVVSATRETGPDPWPAIRAYQATHEKDPHGFSLPRHARGT
jgi:hypothetical protein